MHNGEIMSRTDVEKVRVTITLDTSVYERIKKIAARIGLRPSTWISMVTTSKVNEIDFDGKK